MSDIYLVHHGVKGMKWGVRRYQNPDGTRTTAGKVHERNSSGLSRAAKVGVVAAAGVLAVYGTHKAINSQTAVKAGKAVVGTAKKAAEWGKNQNEYKIAKKVWDIAKSDKVSKGISTVKNSVGLAILLKTSVKELKDIKNRETNSTVDKFVKTTDFIKKAAETGGAINKFAKDPSGSGFGNGNQNQNDTPKKGEAQNVKGQNVSSFNEGGVTVKANRKLNDSEKKQITDYMAQNNVSRARAMYFLDMLDETQAKAITKTASGRFKHSMNNDYLVHHGVKGMKWGVRHDPKVAGARQAYKTAIKNEKRAVKAANRSQWGFGIKGLETARIAESSRRSAAVKTANARAKYAAAKAQAKGKDAEKAEFNAYRKSMQTYGLRGSTLDKQSYNSSTAIYNSVASKKGKAYAQKMEKSVRNHAVATLAGATAYTVGVTAVQAMLLKKR